MLDVQTLIQPSVLRVVVRERGMTQADIAQAIGVNQSQVSRMLAAEVLPSTHAAHKLCEWVLKPSGKPTTDEVLANTELVSAMAFVWDGSPQHASALAAVIRSLRVLRPSSRTTM